MSEKSTRKLPLSICGRCWLVCHANWHKCPDCGALTPRGESHKAKKAKA